MRYPGNKNALQAILIIMCSGLFFIQNSQAQIPPPGAERERQLYEEQMKQSVLDRDSITVTDTTVIFDPNTYEQEVKIITSRYSLRDYLRVVYGIDDAEFLLDRQPHIIIDPRTYEDITIRLTPDGRIERVPK